MAAGVLYECGLPPLHLASARGDLDAVRIILDGFGDNKLKAALDEPSPLPFAGSITCCTSESGCGGKMYGDIFEPPGSGV